MLLAKKYLGLFEFDENANGIVYIFSDFNIQDPQNMTFLEHVIISISIISEKEKPDAIILCGPFTNDMLINSKEDQDTLEETFKNFSTLLLKYQSIT